MPFDLISECVGRYSSCCCPKSKLMASKTVCPYWLVLPIINILLPCYYLVILIILFMSTQGVTCLDV